MATEGFLESCLEGYESEMDAKFYSAGTTAELAKSHEEVKAHIIAQLPQKWSSVFRTKPMPSTYADTLSKDIDRTFKQLKKQFEKLQIRDQNKSLASAAQQDAMQFYNEEVEKYFINNPNASPKDIETHHAKCSLQAISKACDKGGEAMTAEAISCFKMELEKRRQVYTAKATMSLRTLKNPAIGIDLGTTMCCVMVFNKGKVEIIQNREYKNSNTTPSYVAYHEDGSNTYGMIAKEAAHRYAETTIYDAKRMIGRSWSDPKLQAHIKTWPFRGNVVNDDNRPKIRACGKLRSPQDISARLLAQFRVMADQHFVLPQGSVRKAVITVPAYFTEPQRRATSEAAQCAGFHVLNILSEPTAAAIAYCWERTTSGKRKALVYDLGGGTFDVSIAEVAEGQVKILGVDGDTQLGGQDFDELLMKYCADEFKKIHNVDLMASRRENKTMWSVTNDATLSFLSRLKMECEKAKERLSTAEFATVEVMKAHGDENLTVKITRSKLNELVRPLVQTTIDIMSRALNDVKEKGVKSKLDIDDVILVGGSTRMPLVIEMVKDFFDGKELCKNINPDEAIAYGAAVQAALLNNCEDMRKLLITDVTPMTLGTDIVVDDDEDVFGRIIPKNTEIPCKRTVRRVTMKDNQKNFWINVYQGEDDKASKNKWLGEFTLEGFPLKPAGEEGAKITMEIDEWGMLLVTAVQNTTGASSNLKITSDKLGIMSKAEMENLQKEICTMNIK